MHMTVTQSGDGALDLLTQFHESVGWIGRLSGPYIKEGRLPIYRWIAHGHEACQQVLIYLWPMLGNVKRSQAIGRLKSVR